MDNAQTVDHSRKILGHVAEVTFYAQSLDERLTWGPDSGMTEEQIKRDIIKTCNTLEARAREFARYAHAIAGACNHADQR